MADSIYIVDPKTQKPIRVNPVSFSDIKIKERSDLQQWVVNHAEFLGEPLLIVTTEFSGFDKSSRRLDVLALDKSGALTVIELKLDAAGSLADLQAIRYAAFCSTMTMRTVVEQYASHHGVSEDDAEKAIIDFLDSDELPELSGQPRIILAAGSIDDQELTACALWLRKFGVNIRCVELTPYRLPATEQIVVAPRVIIPLRETSEYMIKAEQKEAYEQRSRSVQEPLWRAIADEFNKLGLEYKTAGWAKPHYMQVPVGMGKRAHYEWMTMKREHAIYVAIHFEDNDLGHNQEMLRPIEAKKSELSRLLGQPLFTGSFGKRWTQARISMPYNGTEPLPETARKAAALMKSLIDATWSLVNNIRDRQ